MPRDRTCSEPSGVNGDRVSRGEMSSLQGHLPRGVLPVTTAVVKCMLRAYGIATAADEFQLNDS